VKADWNEAFLAELETFPFGTHDDQVDAAADAFNELFDAEGSSGFQSMVAEDLAVSREAEAVKIKSTALVSAEESGCPHPKGSLEYLKWHGLVT
jgi:hypothetical protein